MGRIGLLLFFFIAYNLSAQSVSVRGKVTNADTGSPVPYATVGIAGKALGTVANGQGEFAFTIPAEKASPASRMIISSVGFEIKELPAAELSQGPGEVKLIPQAAGLPEVVVKPQKAKKRILGKNERNRLLHTNFFTVYETLNDALGKEKGMILNLNKDCFCNDFNVNFSTNTFSLVKFRLNLYEVENGLPHNLLLKEDIIFEVKDQQKGWVKVDLKKHQIFLEGKDKVAVTIQWIESRQAGKKYFLGIPTSSPSVGHTLVYRDKSQAEWKTFNGNMSMYFNADCYDRN